MCSDFKLLDNIIFQNRFCTRNAITSSRSLNNLYCMNVEDGFYVLQLCGFMHSTLPTLSFKKVFTEVPEYIVSSNLGIHINSFITDLPQYELYEAVLRLDVSEKLNESTYNKQVIIQTSWSPPGLIANSQCVIATLTNTGATHMLVPTNNEVETEKYIPIVNVSQCCIDYFKKSWSEFNNNNPSAKYEELKRRSDMVTPTCVAWSHLINNNNKKFCLFFVGHLDGGLTVWKIDARENNDIRQANLEFIGYNNNTGIKKITTIQWQQAGQNGLLVMGDLDGKIAALSIKNITEDSVTFGDFIYLWNKPDNIAVETIDVLIYKNMMYILAVKGVYIFICLLDECGIFCDIFCFRVGNFQITSLQHFEDNTYLALAYNGVLKEIKISCEDKKIKIVWRHLYIDFKRSSLNTYGLIVSPNRVFIIILINLSNIVSRNFNKNPIQLLVFMNMGKDPLAILMKNSTDTLANFWDCLEILRLDGLIEKKLPCDGLPAGLDYDKLSLIQLKTCLWLAKSSEVMYNKMYTVEEYNILRYDEFRCIIKIKLAINYMQHLLELTAEGTKLSEFHMQSLNIINMFLKEIVCSNTIPTLGLGKNTIDELYDVISAANELEYPSPPICLWCKEKIVGLSCIPYHVDNRCIVSYMPITDLPYYKCSYCASTVHNKLTEVYGVILCPYCDIPMNLISFLIDSNNLNKKENNAFDVASCNCDCLNESIDLDNVEDCALKAIENDGASTDVYRVSSSEDEENNTNVEKD